jgi:hypothetical protein
VKKELEAAMTVEQRDAAAEIVELREALQKASDAKDYAQKTIKDLHAQREASDRQADRLAFEKKRMVVEVEGLQR